MSSGDRHDQLTLQCAVPVAIGTALALGSIGQYSHSACTVIVGSYLFGGLYLSPDLDIEYTNPNCIKRWRAIGLAWVWLPYRHLFRHRGISHWAIIGTAIRLAWLTWLPFFAVVGWLSQDGVADGFYKAGSLVLANWRPLFMIYVGCELSAQIHLAADTRLFQAIDRAVLKRRRRR